jgi:hypothetical protein
MQVAAGDKHAQQDAAVLYIMNSNHSHAHDCKTADARHELGGHLCSLVLLPAVVLLPRRAHLHYLQAVSATPTSYPCENETTQKIFDVGPTQTLMTKRCISNPSAVVRAAPPHLT